MPSKALNFFEKQTHRESPGPFAAAEVGCSRLGCRCDGAPSVDPTDTIFNCLNVISFSHMYLKPYVFIDIEL